jgi:HD-GYP domain-containing protein (c-di-GMP phosphodiesterase class II)
MIAPPPLSYSAAQDSGAMTQVAGGWRRIAAVTGPEETPVLTAHTERYLPLPLQKLKVDQPVPVDIWNRKGTLLLSKDQMLESQKQLEHITGLNPQIKEAHYFELLLGSGEPGDIVAGADIDPLVGWPALHSRLTSLLRNEDPQDSLGNRLAVTRAAAQRMLATHRDLSLFMLVQMLYDRGRGYCASHALLSAAVCQLVAADAGLPEREQAALINAALTMNIGMCALQDQLARQLRGPDDAQRAEVAAHPAESARLLRSRGITDALWLHLVDTHHDARPEHPDPAGDPQAVAAATLWMADQFVARLSPRRSRDGLPPNKAVRSIYLTMQARDAGLANLLVKNLGIYPPGSYVRLRSGEIAIVVGSGERAHQPRALSIFSKDGVQFRNPIPRDTQTLDSTVTDSLVIASHVSIQLDPSRLFAPR